MVVEGQYVGSHWDNLHFEADINQVPADKLGGGQAARPFPQFSSIGIVQEAPEPACTRVFRTTTQLTSY